MRPVVGILAAGGSTRMRGRDKLMEEIDGEPLLARQLRIAVAARHPVLVSLPPGDARRTKIVEAAGARGICVEADPPGMGDSIAALAAAAEEMEAEALLLLLADMPEIETEDIRGLLAAASPGAVVRAASAGGRPGHPVVFPREHFASLGRLTGDRGARDVITAARDVRLVPLADERALTDLDTPEAWAAWRAARRG